MIIIAKIDLTKIDKSKIFQGKKGKYLDIVLVTTDEQDDFGNVGSVAHSQTKEERDSKAKKIYIGNVSKVIDSGGKPKQQQPSRSIIDDDDDIPM